MAHMADTENLRLTIPEGDPASQLSSPGEMEGPDDLKKSSSRFQVARVDSQSDRRGSGEESNTRTASPQSDGKLTEDPESPGARFSISTDSVGNTYDTSSKNYVLNTHEALPCVDHYRNIFSATAQGMKTRPTLAELHEERVSDVFCRLLLSDRIAEARFSQCWCTVGNLDSGAMSSENATRL